MSNLDRIKFFYYELCMVLTENIVPSIEVFIITDRRHCHDNKEEIIYTNKKTIDEKPHHIYFVEYETDKYGIRIETLSTECQGYFYILRLFDIYDSLFKKYGFKSSIYYSTFEISAQK